VIQHQNVAKEQESVLFFLWTVKAYYFSYEAFLGVDIIASVVLLRLSLLRLLMNEGLREPVQNRYENRNNVRDTKQERNLQDREGNFSNHPQNSLRTDLLGQLVSEFLVEKIVLDITVR